MLVFSQWTQTLDVLCEYCHARFGPEGQGYLRLDGSTNRIQREMDVRAFNAAQSKIPVYMISTTAGGQGINLASADVVCLYDTSWNPQRDLQAQDRAHRIGQRKQVRVFRLIGENTMEERILKRARQKLVLDEIVIKKKGETSALLTAVSEKDDTSDEAVMAKMGVKELWSFLAFGADQIRDPTLDQRPALTGADLDTIIDDGRIAGGDLDEGEEDSYDQEQEHKEDVGSSFFWHQDREEAEQLLEDHDSLASSGIGRNVRKLLEQASATDLVQYLKDHNEPSNPQGGHGVLLERVKLHLRGRDTMVDNCTSIFDLQKAHLRRLCSKHDLTAGVTGNRADMLLALVDYAKSLGLERLEMGGEEEVGENFQVKCELGYGGSSCKAHRAGAKCCTLFDAGEKGRKGSHGSGEEKEDSSPVPSHDEGSASTRNTRKKSSAFAPNVGGIDKRNHERDEEVSPRRGKEKVLSPKRRLTLSKFSQGLARAMEEDKLRVRLLDAWCLNVKIDVNLCVTNALRLVALLRFLAILKLPGLIQPPARRLFDSNSFECEADLLSWRECGVRPIVRNGRKKEERKGDRRWIEREVSPRRLVQRQKLF